MTERLSRPLQIKRTTRIMKGLGIGITSPAVALVELRKSCYQVLMAAMEYDSSGIQAVLHLAMNDPIKMF